MISSTSLSSIHTLSHRYRRKIEKEVAIFFYEDNAYNYSNYESNYYTYNYHILRKRVKYSSGTYTFLYINNIKINK